MTLTHESGNRASDGAVSARVPAPRAGLRNPSGPQPNGIFVVVETFVLVLVVALAMVSIIVASADAGLMPAEAAASTVATVSPASPESHRAGATDAPYRTR